MKNKPTKLRRGFSAMAPERVAEISSMGGKAAHKQGRAHVFTSEEAREAALKSHVNRRKEGKT